jgi:hypothetical protein
MSTKAVKGVKVKDGKLVRVRPFLAGKKERDAARLAKRWEAKKSPRRSEG